MKTLLIILCALCANVAFSQNVRTKPVVKKQTTTKVATKSTPKKTVAKKKTTKKKKSYNYYYDDYAVDSVAYAVDTIAYEDNTPQWSESAIQLAQYLLYPIGSIEINQLEKTSSYSSIETALRQNYKLNSINSDDDEVWVYARDNPSLNNKYHSLPFDYYCIDAYNSAYSWWRTFSYQFEIKKNDMTMGMYDYLDLIVNDLRELGFPISYKKLTDQNDKAAGEYRNNEIKITIGLTDYGSTLDYIIRVYLY